MLLKIGQRPDHGFDEPLGLLGDCHRRIEQFLDMLIGVAADAAAGPLSAVQRTQLEAALDYFAVSAPRHTADEDESLFPRLKQAADPAAARALELLAGLEEDHRRAEEHHRAVDALGRRWLTDGTIDTAAADALRQHVEALRAIYGPHIAIEDRDLFPAAARLLSAEQLRAIGREMATRRRR